MALLRETGRVKPMVAARPSVRTTRRARGLALFSVLTVTVGVLYGGAAHGNSTPSTTRRASAIPTTKSRAASGRRSTPKPKPNAKRTSAIRTLSTTRRSTSALSPAAVLSSVAPIDTVSSSSPSTPGTIAIGIVAAGSGKSGAVSPVAFDRSRVPLTIAAGPTYDVPFFINVTAGFAETLQLRVPVLPSGLSVRFDPNPVRNYFTMTVRADVSTLPAIDFDIEASSSVHPTVVLARTTVTLFVTGTTGIGGPIEPATGDPLAPPGVVYTLTPSTLQVTRGTAAASVRIDLSRQGNYSGPVSFQVNGALPVGVITSFQANAVSGNVNYLFVSADASAVPGTYVFGLEGVSAIQRTQLRVTLVVQ